MSKKRGRKPEPGGAGTPKSIRKCAACNGKGVVQGARCPACGGKGYIDLSQV